MFPWTLLDYKSLYLIVFCNRSDMASWLVPLSCVKPLVKMQLKAFKILNMGFRLLHFSDPEIRHVI